MPAYLFINLLFSRKRVISSLLLQLCKACSTTSTSTSTSRAGMASAGAKHKKVGQSSSSEVEVEVEVAECECCGLSEECTAAYIAGVRDKFGGRWICGLCSEAVKEERVRSSNSISTKEALDRHIKFCAQFKSWSPPPANPAHDNLISTMKHLLRTTTTTTTPLN